MELDDIRQLIVGNDNLNLKQIFFDASHPVDSTYVQYPQQKSPEDVFNKDGVTSTWQVINYSGAFFRAEGGNAATFIKETDTLIKQSDQNKSHSHGGSVGYGGVDHTHTTNVYHRHYSDGGGHNHDALWGNNNDGTENGVVGNCSGSRYQGTITRTDGSHAHWSNTGIYDNGLNYIGGDGTWNVGSGGASAYSHNHSLSINADGGDESRPTNFTIRIWKRIS